MKPLSNKGRFYKLLIYVVVIVLVNMAGITLFFRADLTSGKVYSLSEASRKVVATLSEPLTIKVFFSSNLPAPYNNIERYLHDLLEEYSIAGNRYFNYQFYDVSGEENERSMRNQELARNYGIQAVQIQAIEHDEVKFQKAYMGMALIHGDIIETLPAITSTEGLEYSITSAIMKMNNKISALLRLEDNISVKLFLSSSLRTVSPYMNIEGLIDLPSRIESAVSRLNLKNFGKLSFTHIDPSTDMPATGDAEQYNILKLSWKEFEDRKGQKIPSDSGYAGIVVEHGKNFRNVSLIDVISLPIFGTQYSLSELEELEAAIDDSIETVININKEIGYLADHGTLPLGDQPMPGLQQHDSLTSLSRLLSDSYSLRPVNLKEGRIPDGLSFMMIAGAGEPFSDYELYHIDQYLMKGNSIALFMDSFREISPQGQFGMMGQRSSYIPVTTGLEKLLAHYGLNVRKSIVLDENSYKQRVPPQFGGGQQQIYFAPIIKNEKINKEADFLKNIKGLIMLKASPVEVDAQKAKDMNLKVTVLFSSSDRAWEMSENIDLNPMFMNPPGDEKEFKSMPLAYIAEGAFTSYFSDKPVPPKEEKMETEQDINQKKTGDVKKETHVDMSKIAAEGSTIKKGSPAKIFLVGTSEILKDSVIDEEGKAPNAQFVMNVIDYMNNRSDIAVMRSKSQSFNPLKDIPPAAKAAVKTVNIAGIPVMVVIAGIIIWYRRAARKRMIQQTFSRQQQRG